MVFMRQWRSKQRHDTVAEHLIDGPCTQHFALGGNSVLQLAQVKAKR